MVCIGVADPGGVKSWEQQFMWNRNDSFERAQWQRYSACGKG